MCSSPLTAAPAHPLVKGVNLGYTQYNLSISIRRRALIDKTMRLCYPVGEGFCPPVLIH